MLPSKGLGERFSHRRLAQHAAQNPRGMAAAPRSDASSRKTWTSRSALEEESGKLFPASNRARTVLDALLGAAERAWCRAAAPGKGVRGRTAGCGWLVKLEAGEPIRAGRVVLATGGLSVPSTGSDGAGLRIAARLGHTVIPTYPALTPLTTSSKRTRHWPESRCGDAGEHTPAEARDRLSYRAASSSRTAATAVRRSWTSRTSPCAPPSSAGRGRSLPSSGRGSMGPAGKRRCAAGTGPVLAVLRQHIPERLALALLEELELAGVRLGQLRREDRLRLVDALTHYPLPWSGHEGYRVAEVTGGGVPLGEVNTATLESRVAPGPVPVRRNAGCVRADRGVQLPLGMGHGQDRGAGGRKAISTCRVLRHQERCRWSDPGRMRQK